jgi:heptosyltransferase-2
MAQKILVIQTAFIGDALLAIPLIRNLRLLYPEAEVTLVCRKGLGPFFTGAGLVHRAIEVNKRGRSVDASALKPILREHFDLLVCPHRSSRSTWWSWRVRARRKIGFSGLATPLVFDETHPFLQDLPDGLRQLRLIASLDEKLRFFFETEAASYANVKTRSSPVDYRSLPLPDLAEMTLPLELLRDRAREAPGEQQDLVVRIHRVDRFAQSHRLNRRGAVFLAPGSVWATKRWPEAYFQEVCREMLKAGRRVVLVGSGEERALCERVANGHESAVVAAGEFDLLETLFLFQYGRLLLTNDSGAMHLASAAGLPVVGLFGPTTLELGYRPWQRQAVVVQRDLPCRPCGKHGHQKCPIGTHACMRELTVQSVLRALSMEL